MLAPRSAATPHLQAGSRLCSGGGGIRTLGAGVTHTTVFETARFNHSRTPPGTRVREGSDQRRRAAKKSTSSAAHSGRQHAAGDGRAVVEARLGEDVEDRAGGAGLRVGGAVDDVRDRGRGRSRPRTSRTARASRRASCPAAASGRSPRPRCAERDQLGVGARDPGGARARCGRRRARRRRRRRRPRRRARRRARARAAPRRSRAASAPRAHLVEESSTESWHGWACPATSELPIMLYDRDGPPPNRPPAPRTCAAPSAHLRPARVAARGRRAAPPPTLRRAIARARSWCATRRAGRARRRARDARGQGAARARASPPPRGAGARGPACSARRRTTSRTIVRRGSPATRARRASPAGWQQMQWNFLADAGVNAPEAWAAPDGRRAPRRQGRHRRGAGHRGRLRGPRTASAARRTSRRTASSAGYDFVGDDPYPNDDNGHGTHVASTIAENAGNGDRR